MRDDSMRHYRGGASDEWGDKAADDAWCTVVMVIIFAGGLALAGHLLRMW